LRTSEALPVKPDGRYPAAMECEYTVQVELLPEHPAFGDPEAASSALTTAHQGDVGIDLIACEEAIIGPGERAIVSAGIRIALPRGLEAQVRPRSGQALKRGLTVPNSPGTIDPGYRGPVKVIAGPASDESLRDRLAAGLAARTLRIERGDRIAQLVFARFERPAIEIVSSVPIETTRGEGGFGSTGAG